MTEAEAKLQDDALAFAKAKKKQIAARLANPDIYPPEEHPVSVFMAGSPGAGKTEAAIELIQEIGSPIVRIDVDELRKECPGYTGDNAWLFQKAASVLVEKLHDVALEQDQSFVLDATFSNFDRARKNASRSLGRGRAIQILYVYQEPSLAWKFVQARENLEGRRVPPEQFVDQYFGAREVVNRVKKEFGDRVRVDLLLKNIDNSSRIFQANVDQIDNYIPEKYSRAEVEKIVQPA
jgi:UDP-N-acetylglucosamine kinase